MTPTQLDITVPQGANFELNVAVKNSDRTAKDLSGYSGQMQVRASVTDSSILLEASTVNGYLTFDAVNGIVKIKVPADITGAMVWTEGVYDLEISTTPQNVLRILKGNAALDPQVTR